MTKRLAFCGLVLLAIGLSGAGREEPAATRFTMTPAADTEKKLAAARAFLAGEEKRRAVPLLAELLDEGDETVRPRVLGLLREHDLVIGFTVDTSEPARRALADAAKSADPVADLLAVFRRFEPAPAGLEAMERLMAELARRNRPMEALGLRRVLGERLPTSLWKSEVLAAFNSLDLRPWTAAPDAGAPGDKVAWTQPLRYMHPHAVEALKTADERLRARRQPVPWAARPLHFPALLPGGGGSILLWVDHAGMNIHEPETGNRHVTTGRSPLKDIVAGSLRGVGAIPESARDTSALFDNTRIGRVAVGNGLVYQISDALVRPAPGGGEEAQPPFNSLEAWLLLNGKLRWVCRNLNDAADARIHPGFFLGPPLVLRESLLALVEKDLALKVVRLDGPTGKIQDVRRLGSVPTPLGTDPVAARRAHHLVAWNGLVIVPTGCGELLGLDLPTLTVRWRYAYHEDAGAAPGPGIAYEPCVVGDRLYYAGPDSRKVHAVDPLTGKAVWTVPVADGDQHLTPVHAGGVVVVGAKALRRLDAATGKTLWSLETGLVAGEGYEGKGGLYYHPVVGEKDGPDAVVVVDLAQGKEVRRIAMPKGFRLGNLVPMGPLVVNATPFAVSVLGEGR